MATTPTETKGKESLLAAIGRILTQPVASRADQDFFIDSIALLVGSGMDVEVAVASMRTEMRSSAMRRLVSVIASDIDSGVPLWRAMEKSHLLSGAEISLVRIGESSGRLVSNFKLLSLQRRKERMFSSRLLSALAYPLFVLVVMLVVGTATAWFVLPHLAVIFTQLHVPLPVVTQILLGFGAFLGMYGVVAVPTAVVAIIFIIYVLFFFKPTKGIGDLIIFQTPGVGLLTQQVEVGRFGFLLGTLLEAGVPIVEAIEALSNSASLASYRRLYQFFARSIEEGNAWRTTFEKAPGIDRLLPLSVQQVIVAAEQSGRVVETLRDVGTAYEEKTDITTKNIVTALEPLLLIVVWLGVVSLALAIILPIYRLVGSLNT